RSFETRVGQDGPNRVDLSLVVVEAGHDRIEREGLEHLPAGHNGLAGDCRQRGGTDDRQLRELAGDRVDTVGNTLEGDPLSRGIDVLQALRGALELKTSVELLEIGEG